MTPLQEKDLPILIKHSSAPVRRHLLMAAFVMLLTMIFDRELLVLYLFFGVLGALAIIFLASFTTTRHHILIYVDAVISAFMFVFFEYSALSAYSSWETVWNKIFILRQAVALLFLGTLYVTLRVIRQNRLIEELESKT